MPTPHAYETRTAVARKGKKFFTLDEANRSLVYVKRVVTDITECYQQAVQVRQRLERPAGDAVADVLRDEYEQSMSHLNDLIDELQQVGVELKDFEKGLLDFPSLHEGREIYLCWHRGEDRVRCWHETDSGFAGRKDVRLLEHARAA
ncbi:MAG: DUF2203 family protein [Phycisphaera sp.]|nr:DUF2203 family protein [Phycisphaera sp.]